MKGAGKQSIALIFLALCTVGVAACSPFGMVAGVGATVGAATVDERGLAGSADDAALRIEINAKWATEDPSAFTSVGLMIYQGEVVLTGSVSTVAQRNKAVALVQEVSGVKQVYNHIRVDPDAGVADLAEDGQIVASMRRAIFFDKDILSINYNIDASERTLYLQGMAQDEQEKWDVLAHAWDISGVRSIVDYIKIKDPEPVAKKQDTNKD